MALPCPDPIDITEIQFKLHHKYRIGTDITEFNENVNLLASASSIGLIIVACLQPPQLRVTLLNSIVDNKDSDNVPLRIIPLSSTPRSISLSCDHSQLAVSISQNGQGFIAIYSVSSFLSQNVIELLRIPVEANVTPTQMIWNPVISNTLAVCFNSGALEIYVVKGNTFEFFTIDKSEQTRCASWSPKGKQIVVGFSNGKLAQYKPDLKLAKTIPCPPNIYAHPFDVIAIQWLSTYQFAAVFLQNIVGACPALHIINAPKTGTPAYINYDDICFSQAGPRKAQIYLSYIAQWSLLLVGCANSMEIAVLGTAEATETPTWRQYVMLDEARAELPLTEDKQETSPVGLSLDTGCTHQLMIGETKLPVMPMIHLLSIDGLLVCFNLLNIRANTPSICSPPPPFADTSGFNQFKMIESQKPINTTSEPTAPASYANFGSPLGITSTPTTQKPKAFFSPAEPKANLFGNPLETPQTTSLSGQTSSSIFNKISQTVSPQPSNNEMSMLQTSGPQPTWSMQGSPSIFGGVSAAGKNENGTKQNAGIFSNSNKPLFSAPPNVTAQPNVAIISSQPQSINQQSNVTKSTGRLVTEEVGKPLITVHPVYNAPASESQSSKIQSSDSKTTEKDSDESSAIIKKIILEEIQSFENLLSSLLARSQIDIRQKSRDEAIIAQKQLNGLTNIVNQAVESTDELTSEIHSLKLSINETFSMAEEAKSKYLQSSESEYSISMSQTSRRQLEKLQNILTVNEHQLQLVSKEIDGHWSAYQDMLKQNKKSKMHIPSLESVYQTLTKQREILNRHRMKINYVRNKLGFKDSVSLITKKKLDLSINSLSESLLSMTLADQIKSEKSSFSQDKQKSLRDLLKNRKTVNIIKPKRPNRKGFNSEIVLEKRLAQAKLSQVKVLTSKGIPESDTRTEKPFEISSISTHFNHREVKPIKPTSDELKNLSQQSFGLAKDTPGFAVKQKTIPMVTITPRSDGDTKPPPQSFSFFSPLPSNVGLSTVFQSKTDSISSPLNSFNFKSDSKLENKSVTLTPIVTQAMKPSEGNIAHTTPKPTMAAGAAAAPFEQPEIQKISFGVASTTAGVSMPKSQTIFVSAIPSPIPFGSKVQFDKPSPMSAVKQPETEAFKFTTKIVEKSDKENIISSDMSKLMSISQGKSTTSTVVATTGGGDSLSNLLPQPPANVSVQKLETASTPQGFADTPIASTAASPSVFSGFNLNVSKTIVSSSSPTSISGDPFQMASTNFTGFNISLAPQKTAVGNVSSTTITPVANKPATTAAITSTPSSTTFSFASFAAATPAVSEPAKDAENIIQNLNICKPTVTKSPSSPNGGKLFSLNSFNSPPNNQPASSIFGGPSTPNAQTQSGFAGILGSQSVTASTTVSQITTPTTATTTTPSSPFSGIFANANTIPISTASKPLFANTPATETTNSTTSVFGNVNTPSVFGASATTVNTFQSSNSIFGGTQANTASIFGGSSNSIFGVPKQETSSTFGSVPAAETNAAPNVFGQTPSQPASGGSIFGGSSFGSGAQQQQNSNSIFGGGSQTVGVPGSFSFNQQQSTGGSFNSSSVFGGATSGSFNQTGGPSIAQTGFGGANGGGTANAGNGSNIFGGQQTAFGATSAPVFGAAPAFGGAATFGSPKTGFGTFANVNVSPTAGNTFGSGTAKNSLFETLGSSETGMTFGNIAQNANLSKPAFGGGTSFSTWR